MNTTLILLFVGVCLLHISNVVEVEALVGYMLGAAGTLCEDKKCEGANSPYDPVSCPNIFDVKDAAECEQAMRETFAGFTWATWWGEVTESNTPRGCRSSSYSGNVGVLLEPTFGFAWNNHSTGSRNGSIYPLCAQANNCSNCVGGCYHDGFCVKYGVESILTIPSQYGYENGSWSPATIGVTNETFCNYLADSWTTWAPAGLPGGWHVACEGQAEGGSEATDCEWKEWNPKWSKCRKGVQIRTRQIKTKPTGGGKECEGKSEQTRKCMDPKKCWNLKSKSKCREIKMKGKCGTPYWRVACCKTCGHACVNIKKDRWCRKRATHCRRDYFVKRKCRKTCGAC